MKKIIIPIALCLALITNLCIAYNKDDLKQFQTTVGCQKCDLLGLNIATPVDHKNAVIAGSNLSFGSLQFFNFTSILGQGSNFNHTYFDSVNFSYANLQNAVFSYANIQAVNFDHADLANARFIGADGLGADFKYTDLTGAKFMGATLRVVDFTGAKGLDLSGALQVCGGINPDGSKQKPC